MDVTGGPHGRHPIVRAAAWQHLRERMERGERMLDPDTDAGPGGERWLSDTSPSEGPHGLLRSAQLHVQAWLAAVLTTGAADADDGGGVPADAALRSVLQFSAHLPDEVAAACAAAADGAALVAAFAS